MLDEVLRVGPSRIRYTSRVLCGNCGETYDSSKRAEENMHGLTRCGASRG